ncbi:MAG TPA: hypothetical protein PLJ22_03415, partial [Kiritimatiellia bacterium]|nr:hypothetical protein [Kiritimatiellia bacterium]
SLADSQKDGPCPNHVDGQEAAQEEVDEKKEAHFGPKSQSDRVPYGGPQAVEEPLVRGKKRIRQSVE